MPPIIFTHMTPAYTAEEGEREGREIKLHLHTWAILFLTQRKLTDPNVIQIPDDFLEFGRNFRVYIMVETRLETALFRQGRPIVKASSSRSTRVHHLFSAIQFGRSSVQFGLSPMEIVQSDRTNGRLHGWLLTVSCWHCPLLTRRLDNGRLDLWAIFLLEWIVVFQPPLVVCCAPCYLLYCRIL